MIKASQKDWTKYRDPAEEPDARSERDMNTFLSVTSDMLLTSMSETMDFIRKIEIVADCVQIVWSDSLANGNLIVQSRSRGYIEQFSDMILEKVDSATAH